MIPSLRWIFLFCFAAGAFAQMTPMQNLPFSTNTTNWLGQGCVNAPYGVNATDVYGYITWDVSGKPVMQLQYCDPKTNLWEQVTLANAVNVPQVHFADAELPTGTIDGKNATFTLAHTPVSAPIVVLNGVVEAASADYTLASATLTFVRPPAAGDSLAVWYRY